MYGSLLFKWVWGKWDHVGTLQTSLIPLSAAYNPNLPNWAGTPGVSGLIPRGTWLDNSLTDDNSACLASGNTAGLMTQDLNAYGTTSPVGFKQFTIGQFDLPVAQPHPISLRMPVPGALIEFEGVGAAMPGNLVCTTGTGALSTATARGKELSVLNGCLRLAQIGDLVIGVIEMTSGNTILVPNFSGNLRIRMKAVGPYIKDA